MSHGNDKMFYYSHHGCIGEQSVAYTHTHTNVYDKQYITLLSLRTLLEHQSGTESKLFIKQHYFHSTIFILIKCENARKYHDTSFRSYCPATFLMKNRLTIQNIKLRYLEEKKNCLQPLNNQNMFGFLFYLTSVFLPNLYKAQQNMYINAYKCT